MTSFVGRGVCIDPTPTPFVAPVYLATLTVPSDASAVEAVNLRKLHKESTYIYRKYRNVEKALLRHIQNSRVIGFKI